MKRVRLVLLILALALGLVGVAGPAQGQGVSIGALLFGGPGKVLAEVNVQAVIRGQLVVSFRGDAGAGCSAYGVCAYAGTIIARPSAGSLSVVTYRLGGRIGHQATLVLNGFGNGLTTYARVQRSGPAGEDGTCADAGSAMFGAASGARIQGRSLTIRLLAPGGSLLQTRCAGPLDGDLAGAGPAVTIPLARAVHGRAVLDLSGTRAFAAHGFAGTVSSTIVMRLGKPQSQSTSPVSSGFPPGIRVARVRTVTQQLTLARLHGEMTAAVQGASDPIVCGLLDSCGLIGTLSLDRAPRGVVAQVVAMGPASRPYRDFLTALGLSHSGRSHGIAVAVFVAVEGGVRAGISQGGAACSDAAATGGVTASIGVASGGSAFGISGSFGAFARSWRTRCPGPDLANLPGGLTGVLGRGGLGRRQVAIELRAKGSFTDDGYVVTPQGRLSAVLRRGRIHQQVNLQPVP